MGNHHSHERRKIVGIDLGTTKSVIAAWDKGIPVVIPSCDEESRGELQTPSVVAFDKKGTLLKGSAAKRQAHANPENTIFSIKRLMGRKFKDPSVQANMKKLPYRITEASNGDCRVVMGSEEYSPPKISAMILQKLMTDAEACLGEEPTDAVITVPACFSASQRQATEEAARIAGLNVLRLINEPAAACLAHGLYNKRDLVVAVVHFGGGTFNLSVVDMGDGVFEERPVGGNTHLGGDDFDQRILDWLCEKFENQAGIDLRRKKETLLQVREAAEKAKRELSTKEATDVILPCIMKGSQRPIRLSRSKMQQLVGDLVDESIDSSCRKAIENAGLKLPAINEVWLVGGQTQMPLVQDRVEKFFGLKPKNCVNDDQAVALGAATQGAIISGDVKDMLVVNATPIYQTLGIETLGGLATPMIERNRSIPTTETKTFTTVRDYQDAVQVHIIQGERLMAADNGTLARFVFDEILPAPRGVPQIEITLNLRGDGALDVTVNDKRTGRRQLFSAPSLIEASRDSGGARYSDCDLALYTDSLPPLVQTRY